MKWKKVMSGILVASMTAALLAGCGGNSGEEQAAPDGSKTVHFLTQFPELAEMILFFPHIDHSHIHERHFSTIYTNDPEAQKIGSGVNSHYGSGFHHAFILSSMNPKPERSLTYGIETGIRSESFRNDDLPVFLVILQQRSHYTRQSKGTSVQGMSQPCLPVSILIPQFQSVGLI